MLRSGLILGTLAVAAFGMTLPLTRIAVMAISPADVFILRLLLASILASGLLLMLRVCLPPRQHWRSLVWVSAGVVIGFPLFTSLAMHSAAATHGGVVLGILPIATALVGSLCNQERPSAAFWMTALVGCALVVAFALSGVGALAIADVYLFFAVLCAAVGYAVGGKLSAQLPAWQVISWALALALPVALILAAWVDWPALTPAALATNAWSVWWSVAYLGLVSQFGGFLLWYRALALDGVARTSQLQLLQPFFTLMGAAVLLGEVVDGRTALFALLILLTVSLSRRAPIDTRGSKEDHIVSNNRNSGNG